MSNRWDARTYEQNARFVSDLGVAVLGLLSPQPGERILDVGCGDGALTLRIVERGATVVGIDSSSSMVEASRAKGIDARIGSAAELPFDGEFDAVFSNAALHWVPDAEGVVRGVARALRPNGRFVAEFGGFGNIAAIRVAQDCALARRGVRYDDLLPKYFPTPGAYGALLEKHGFHVDWIDLIPRPTPLAAGMRGWLETFSRAVLDRIEHREAFLEEVVDALKPVLCDEQGNWSADYVRLRVKATRA